MYILAQNEVPQSGEGSIVSSLGLTEKIQSTKAIFYQE
jgi:hypothetical protein